VSWTRPRPCRSVAWRSALPNRGSQLRSGNQWQLVVISGNQWRSALPHPRSQPVPVVARAVLAPAAADADADAGRGRGVGSTGTGSQPPPFFFLSAPTTIVSFSGQDSPDERGNQRASDGTQRALMSFSSRAGTRLMSVAIRGHQKALRRH